jgi:hypothetical protein
MEKSNERLYNTLMDERVSKRSRERDDGGTRQHLSKRISKLGALLLEFIAFSISL